jgi:hypothetical protein
LVELTPSAWPALALTLGTGLALLLASLWAIGAREPVYAIGASGWFVAWKRAPGAPLPELAPGVRVAWAGRADFAFIGADTPYWTDFLILDGGEAGRAPAQIEAAEDAYVARLRFMKPPAIALGLLRTMVALGILAKPKGAISAELQTRGFRASLMPSSGAIAELLRRPPSYAPRMVNFLGYYDRAADGAGSGRAAYRRYGQVAMRTVYRTGGRLLFYGVIDRVVREARAGPTMGAWSDIAAMVYPNPPAILSMEHAKDYRAALQHRDAGLERTVVIASSTC